MSVSEIINRITDRQLDDLRIPVLNLREFREKLGKILIEAEEEAR